MLNHRPVWVRKLILNFTKEVVTEKEEFPFEKKDAFEIAISVKEDKFVVCSKFFFNVIHLSFLNNYPSSQRWITLVCDCLIKF